MVWLGALKILPCRIAQLPYGTASLRRQWHVRRKNCWLQEQDILFRLPPSALLAPVAEGIRRQSAATRESTEIAVFWSGACGHAWSTMPPCSVPSKKELFPVFQVARLTRAETSHSSPQSTINESRFGETVSGSRIAPQIDT